MTKEIYTPYPEEAIRRIQGRSKNIMEYNNHGAHSKLLQYAEMDGPSITMEEYVHYETEKDLRNGKVYNWETATYGKISSHLNLRMDVWELVVMGTPTRVKPIDRLSLNTFLISHIPKNPPNALKDPQWHNAMYDEYNALVKNGIWLLVLRPACVNMVRSMWLFKHKFHADWTLSRYKARLVANGSSQQLGVDFDETFSPVVTPATIRTVISLAVSRKWSIHQLDVKNAFLSGDLSETVYMHQPPSFVDARFPNHVCRLQRSLYGLKQAPRAWFQRFAGYATRAEFYHSRCDSSLFLYRHGSQVAYLLIYVDDIILTTSSPALLQQIIYSLHNEFDMIDLGALNYYLGISADRNSTSLFLSQRKNALQLLEHAHMVHCNPSRTPVDTESKLGPEGVPVCLYMHDPREPHFAALKRILRYVRGTVDFGLQLYASATTSLVGYTDADWAGCPSTRMSTSGYCVFLGDNLLSWSAKRQHTLSRSSVEAEYRGVANVVAETAWLPIYSVRVLHVLSRYQYVDISPNDSLQLCLKNFGPV
ncbi:ribonuclease H-like domain-containing protein [Tanacetum coccineum]